MRVRASLFLVTALTYLLAVVLTACGGSPAATATPTTAATATDVATDFPILYTSAEGNYSLKRPGNWTATPITADKVVGAVGFSSDEQQLLFLVEPFTFLSTATPQDLLKGALSGQSFTGAKTDPGTDAQTFPSGAWKTATGSAIANGVTLNARLYETAHNNRTVVIITLAPPATETVDQQLYFLPILNSFVFLS
jgi:hypothetical protein